MACGFGGGVGGSVGWWVDVGDVLLGKGGGVKLGGGMGAVEGDGGKEVDGLRILRISFVHI